MFRLAIFTFLFLTAPSAAIAANVVLMINMNYSSDELKVVKEQAALRGQRVEMVPPEKLIPLVEPMFEKRELATADLLKAFPPRTDKDPEIAKRYADEQALKIKATLGGILRSGPNWEGGPEFMKFLGPQRVAEIYAAGQKVAAAEKANGDIYEQLKRKANELKARGDKVDSMIISSHSDGSNLTGETSNRLSANELSKLKEEQPELFNTPRHVLLMGCYNMTKPNRQTWRNELFPHASMIAGFGIKAPSRYDPTSTGFITQVMGKANELDQEMVAAGTALNPKYLEQVFRSLNSFATKDHPGVVDYCYSVIEGRPNTITCDMEWADIYEWKHKMEAYWSLSRPQEDPPTVSGGELRAFYNNLQAACPAKEANSEKDDWKYSERMRVTLREMTIRLIFWWNVQSNFSTYLESDIRTMNERLRAAGISEKMPKLDGKTSRIDFVGAYNNIRRRLAEDNPSLLEDFQKLYKPLWLLKGEDTVAPGEKIGIDETLRRGAIPFNWIEGTTVMGKR